MTARESYTWKERNRERERDGERERLFKINAILGERVSLEQIQIRGVRRLALILLTLGGLGPKVGSISVS